MGGNNLTLENIEVGDKLEIEVLLKNGITTNTYQSKVVEKLGNGNLIIDAIASGKHLINLPLHATYMFTVYQKKGIYKNKGKIIRNIKSDKDYLVIEFEEVVKKVQRREDFRIDCKIDILYKKIGDPLATEEQHGVIIDLSAGGIKFLANSKLAKNDKFNFSLYINNSICFIESEVMYIDEIDNGSYANQYRCKFNNLLQSDKDRIIQFILDEQRNSLKRKKFGN